MRANGGDVGLHERVVRLYISSSVSVAPSLTWVDARLAFH